MSVKKESVSFFSPKNLFKSFCFLACATGSPVHSPLSSVYTTPPYDGQIHYGASVYLTGSAKACILTDAVFQNSSSNFTSNSPGKNIRIDCQKHYEKLGDFFPCAGYVKAGLFPSVTDREIDRMKEGGVSTQGIGHCSISLPLLEAAYIAKENQRKAANKTPKKLGEEFLDIPSKKESSYKLHLETMELHSKTEPPIYLAIKRCYGLALKRLVDCTQYFHLPGVRQFYLNATLLRGFVQQLYIP